MFACLRLTQPSRKVVTQKNIDSIVFRNNFSKGTSVGIYSQRLLCKCIFSKRNWLCKCIFQNVIDYVWAVLGFSKVTLSKSISIRVSSQCLLCKCIFQNAIDYVWAVLRFSNINFSKTISIRVSWEGLLCQCIFQKVIHYVWAVLCFPKSTFQKRFLSAFHHKVFFASVFFKT